MTPGLRNSSFLESGPYWRRGKQSSEANSSEVQPPAPASRPPGGRPQQNPHPNQAARWQTSPPPPPGPVGRVHASRQTQTRGLRPSPESSSASTPALTLAPSTQSCPELPAPPSSPNSRLRDLQPGGQSSQSPRTSPRGSPRPGPALPHSHTRPLPAPARLGLPRALGTPALATSPWPACPSHRG